MRLFGFKRPKTDRRQEIVAAPFSARMVVEGGPGTGKTAIACTRVAAMAQDQNLPPHSILVVSFTRIAVREIAKRLQAVMEDWSLVRIVTLDALAATLAPELDEVEDHDEQIKQAISALPLCQNLAPLRHVIIDEAHDVVGIRADLTERLIAHLPPECGVTVLADDAQSIYDFADRSRAPKPSLPLRLIETGLERQNLTVLHRTDIPALTRLFDQGRTLVLSDRLSAKARHGKLIRALRKAAPAIDGPPPDETPLVLYRYRADVLDASTALSESGIPHRLRLSGMPPALPAWIGLCLSHHQEPTLSRAAFLSQWRRRVDGTPHAVLSAEDAWERLFRTAPLDREIELGRLRAKLTQASPPLDLCETELGSGGPIVGTIHASKGLEADRVVLAIPTPYPRPPGDEECRVLFVGATRARRDLRLLPHRPLDIHSLPSGRLYQTPADPAAPLRVEIGTAADFLPGGLVGMEVFETVEEARSAQTALAQLPAGPTSVAIDDALTIFWDGRRVARIAPQVNHDLDDLPHGRRRAPILGTGHMIGIRTMVYDPLLQAPLYPPWAASGFVLAPILSGYCRLRCA